MSSNTEPVLSFIRYCFKKDPQFPCTDTYDTQLAWILNKWERLTIQRKKEFEDEYDRMPICCVHCQNSSNDDSGWGAMSDATAEEFAVGFAGSDFIQGWNIGNFPTTLEDGPRLIATLVLKSRGGRLWLCPNKECQELGSKYHLLSDY